MFLLQIAWVSGTLNASPRINETDSADADVIEQIVRCVAAAGEAVLLPQAVKCEEYRKGEDLLPVDTPMNLNAEDVCKELADKPKDLRKLSENAIKQIVRLATTSVDPRGIRILGAIFCKRLDLAGLDLPYSLVLDQSLFKDGFEARNFHTRGDLSFDRSLALGRVAIMRSRIDGTVFGRWANIKELHILDSEIKGSLLFRESVILNPAIFDTVSLSGELSIRKVKLSYLVLQFSKVAGVLDLTESRARCAYLIRKSEIRDLVAVQAGFGPSDRVNLRECGYHNITLRPANFLVSDTRVRSSLCFHSFDWISRKSVEPVTNSIIFNDVNVDASTFIDLAPWGTENNRISASGSRKFEAIGIKTHSFIFNFKSGAEMFAEDGGEPREMLLGGLEFEYAYAVPDKGVPCAYDPKYYDPSSEDVERLESFGRMRPPQFSEIKDWLDRNCLQTSQPVSAFVDAAKRAGDVTEATELQIAKAWKELGVSSFRVFRSILGTKLLGGDRDCSQGPKSLGGIGTASTGSSTPEMMRGAALSIGSVTAESASGGSGLVNDWFGALLDFLNSAAAFLNDAAAVLFGTMLGILAGHGYRPQQVGWLVIAVLAVALVYFRFWARVVAFMPADRNTSGQLLVGETQGVVNAMPANAIRPIGFVFLFDRMLPALRIREENYDVRTYYKRADKANDPASVTHAVFSRRKIPLVKADDKDVVRVERCLDIIKGLGYVFAILLVGALNAMISH
jgi:hypothetical protein